MLRRWLVWALLVVLVKTDQDAIVWIDHLGRAWVPLDPKRFLKKDRE